jgi:hypothetical protein
VLVNLLSLSDKAIFAYPKSVVKARVFHHCVVFRGDRVECIGRDVKRGRGGAGLYDTQWPMELSVSESGDFCWCVEEKVIKL